jgi:hypothetical protein
MNKVIKQQKPADILWADETGNQIPYNRTTPYERAAERKVCALTKEAVRLNELLTAFKTNLKTNADELYEAFLAENNGNPLGKGKGGITLYNFDRSIKIEVSVNEQITFDDNLIGLAKQKLDDLLNDGLSAAKDFIKPLVMDAFSTIGGKLDTKRVLGLRRYASKITDPRYTEAMQLIDKAIRKPKSKEYYCVWVKDEHGEYQDVQLNLSKIKIQEAAI